jgi:hypothetical protein
MTISQIQTLINNIDDNGLNTALDVRNALNAIRESTCYIGEVKIMKVDSSFISTYFDVTGLGLTSTQYEGWAICNGNNGTTDDGGLTYIGYDAVDYPTLGATGGSKDAVIVDHTHNVSGLASVVALNTDAGSGRPNTQTFVGTTGQANGGQSGINKNMQPYRVMLKIQRVA